MEIWKKQERLARKDERRAQETLPARYANALEVLKELDADERAAREESGEAIKLHRSIVDAFNRQQQLLLDMAQANDCEAAGVPLRVDRRGDVVADGVAYRQRGL